MHFCRTIIKIKTHSVPKFLICGFVLLILGLNSIKLLFFAMEWNAKTPVRWDWENNVIPNPKGAGISKLEEWGSDIDGGIDNGPIYSLGGGAGRGGGSGSENVGSNVGNLYSSDQSKSASVDSSSVEKTSEFSLDGFHDHLISRKQLDKDNQTESYQILGASVVSVEPVIGLKLGKRTYFEDLSQGSDANASSVSMHPMTSAPTAKRSRPFSQNISPKCQVDGCGIDLSTAKDYHRKHRICKEHTLFPNVFVNGKECRFCQQCSRLHGLSEFDEKKKSCRKRLLDHNARRRKPQHDAIQLNSPRLGSLIYDDSQQVEPYEFSYCHTTPSGNFTLESSCKPKFTLTKDRLLLPANRKGHDGQMHLLRRPNPSNGGNMLCHDPKWPMPSKGHTVTAEISGLEESMISTNTSAAQGYRALSLLSITNRDSFHSTAFVQSPAALKSHPRPQPLVDTASQGLTSAEQSYDVQLHPFAGQYNSNVHFPEYQPQFKLHYGSGF